MMNLAPLVASCALLGTFTFPRTSLLSTASFAQGSAQTTANVSVEETTIVIRYDPEAIFLTHELVAPLCAREVKLLDEGTGEPLGALVMTGMDGNSLQPRGVFVGRVRLESVLATAAQRREELLEAGLKQLRTALNKRLTRTRHEQLAQHVSVLEAMEANLRQSADEQAQRLAQKESLELMKRQLEEFTAAKRSHRIELLAGQQEVLMATAKVQESQAELEAAKASLMRTRTEFERVQALVDRQVSSGLELQAAQRKLQVAEVEVQAATARVDGQRMQVDKRHGQIQATEDRLAELESRIRDFQQRIDAIPAEALDRSEATLRLGQTASQAQLTALGTELQAAQAALATLQGVTIERW